MIVCLFGRSTATFVEPVVRDFQRLATRRRVELTALTVEDALADPMRCRDAERVYVLPFEVPLRMSPELPTTHGLLIRALFPRAAVVNSSVAHDLCWDKVATVQRLLARGVPMPATLMTSEPDEARDFIRTHGHAVLKEPRSCAGHGHLVVFADDAGTIAGEAQDRRYVIELTASGAGPRLEDGVLEYPGPFFLQRLVAGVGRGGALQAGQILRAYIVDGRILFWTERYRDRIRRPSDFIISVALGARYRFLREVSDEAAKVARRAAEVLGVSIGVVDVIRAGSEGPLVLEVDTDGHHMMIDRGFVQLPEFRSTYDFDDAIVQTLTAPAPEPPVRRRPL